MSILLATQSVQGISLGDTIALAGVVLAVVSAAWGTAWFLSSRMGDQHESTMGSIAGVKTELHDAISSVKEDVTDLGNRMSVLERDTFTKPEAEAHALRLALNNPYLKVPDPRNPATIIHVAESVDQPRRHPA